MSVKQRRSAKAAALAMACVVLAAGCKQAGSSRSAPSGAVAPSAPTQSTPPAQPMGSGNIVGSHIETVNGTSAIVVDYEDGSEPFTDISFMSYSHFGQVDLPAQMADNGTDAFIFMVTLGNSSVEFSKPIWQGVDESGAHVYDFESLDARMANILQAKPDAKVMVHIFTGAPVEWLEQNDDACVVVEKNGERSFYYDATETTTYTVVRGGQRYPSIASEKYREAVQVCLTDIVTRCEELYGGNIFGYMITGLATEEWYHMSWHSNAFDDYSDAMHEKYRGFLTEKYGTDAALQAAWNDGAATLAAAQLPSPQRRMGGEDATFFNLETDRDVVDFYQFYNEIVADTISAFTGYVKDVCPDKIAGAFYGYQYEFNSDPTCGHLALGKLLESPNVDFVKCAAGSINRESAIGGDNQRAPYHSPQLHNKVVVIDNDTVTCMLPETEAYRSLSPADQNTVAESYRAKIGYTSTPELGVEMQKRIVGFSMAQGFVTSYFDLHGGYYNDETLLAGMQRAAEVYGESYGMDRTTGAEVLVVTDEAACYYTQPGTANGNRVLMELKNTSANLMKLGAPYDMILTNDLDRIDPEQYKLILFTNAFATTAAQRAKIEALKGGGRTLAWLYAPGYITEEGAAAENMGALTGIGMEEGKFASLSYRIPHSGDALVQKLWAQAMPQKEITSATGYALQTFYVNDAAATPVGYHTTLAGEEKVVAAHKRFEDNGGWASVYLPTTRLSAEMLRGLADFAGVHLYTGRVEGSPASPYDTTYVGRSTLTLHANGSGPRTVSLPRPCDVYDAYNGVMLAENTQEVTLELENGHTAMLFLLPPQGQQE